MNRDDYNPETDIPLTFWTSWLFALNVFHALYRRCFVFALIMWLVWLTSIFNHGCGWDNQKHPLKATANTIDRIVVFTGLACATIISATAAQTAVQSARFWGSIGKIILVGLLYAHNEHGEHGRSEHRRIEVHALMHIIGSMGVAMMTEVCAQSPSCAACADNHHFNPKRHAPSCAADDSATGQGGAVNCSPIKSSTAVPFASTAPR